ncbi:CDP-diacylglycerol--serine O-phosphatidyltransferase [Clostridium tetanomorphum]|uniref:CDP-diacylglycerol--serine O-phosphatidyltransferase n=1 Tax=Clostridium tetanomorphum TaxID=1553 RepID=A0A923EEG8_CLOTT|nr:CDP-diacylglycerol--serine O-phosphatidyltransferase [Clostridium tetanomorphum]KAJ50430.1 CDP-diacylglycerol--serine O-phosphatidyltransferase [Clostridium tetanomorphum DSM 665]MBC2399438.1 CDP-diacylglycerol--serine O-phosphatidyltransferase [Clostridium tetanomorphum]MBP1865755.1 CDP-diacylglycerol--serine O-phosphatidyltransferase [Clostridium tetanomorphum]NRS86877.1 CDP-diacylglycerol--serine O-phosphatidyltransferase [Clostridium tetanomorphum]NRZ99367.1 CDP-diacylglycerol--serine O
MAKNAVPNIFTLGNLSCGILSLMMTFQGEYRNACLFILLAGLMDRYDGRVARYLNVSSELGKELDSLADLVSFGVAPSILVYNLYNLSNLGLIGYVLLLVFPIAGAYRLARYNTTSFDGIFTGVPITLAGMFMALYSLITMNRSTSPILTISLLVMFSYLMVSKLRFKKV